MLNEDDRFALDIGASSPGGKRRALEARAAAAGMCARYCPAAPATVMAEAALRLTAYLVHVQPGRTRRQVAEGSEQASIWIPAGSSALRASGAAAILSPWKVRTG